MNIYSITFQTVLNAFRHQWKRILASVLVFALLGAAGGFLFRDQGMAEASGSAQPLPAVDFDALPYTQDYYTACLNALSDCLNGLSRYLTVLSNNTNLDGERQAALDAVRVDAVEFQLTALQPLRTVLNEAGAVIVPAEFLDGLAESRAHDLETVRIELISAQTAAETIRQMDAPDYDGSFTDTYTSLLSQALNYGSLLRSQAIYEKILDRLENHMPEIRSENRRVERELNAAEETLTALMGRFLILANEAAKEEGLTLTPKVENGIVKDVIVTHAHRASSTQESFAVIFLFCVLTGLCLGVFLAVCKEAKEERKHWAASQTQKPETSA